MEGQPCSRVTNVDKRNLVEQKIVSKNDCALINFLSRWGLWLQAQHMNALPLLFGVFSGLTFCTSCL